MSSQSSNHSNDADEVCSCDTYSSGWERSSTSEYWDTSDTEEVVEDDTRRICGRDDFYVPPKRTGKPTLFDVEYKCELVVLPHPYKKNEIKVREEGDTSEPKGDYEDKPEPTESVNPWKTVDTTNITEIHDPWKFLEVINKPVEKIAREPRREERRKISRPIDNSNTNKLCKYRGDCRMNRSNNCNMIHNIADWKPRVCRFNNNCKRKTTCGYYHTDTPIKEYLKIMIATPDTIYAKNSALYEKYIH